MMPNITHPIDLLLSDDRQKNDGTNQQQCKPKVTRGESETCHPDIIVVHSKRLMQKDRIEYSGKDEIYNDGSKQHKDVPTCLMPRFQGIFKIDHEGEDCGDQDTK